MRITSCLVRRLLIAIACVASVISIASAQNQPAAAPASAVTQTSWSPQALEELLSPVALYPDALLTQVLAASVNSQEVLDGGNWLIENESLKGDQLDAAAEKAGFGPPMRSLFQVPTVVDMMCQEIDWTRQIGAAFTSDQKAVLDAVQRLRAQAKEAGNLKSTQQQTVTTKTENNQVIVEIKPADPTVIYVPQYDPQVVYTAPPPKDEGVSTEAAIATGLIAFTAGVIVGNAFDDDDYYPHWGYGAVYVGPRPFYPPAYAYRPVYGPAFRPASVYRPPVNYRHSYNNVNVNNNINVNVNNSRNSYFNRFDKNKNLHAGATRSPLSTNHAGTPSRAGGGAAADRAENWKGKDTYAGSGNTSNAARTAQAQNTRQPQANRDRGYGDAAGATTSSAARPAAPKTTAHDSAFSGAGSPESASFDRAASARGHASTSPSRQHVASRGGGSRRG